MKKLVMFLIAICFTGCSTAENFENAIQKSRLKLLLQYPVSSEADGFFIRIYNYNEETKECAEEIYSAYAPILSNFDLADLFLDLFAGLYCVKTQPMKAPDVPLGKCTVAIEKGIEIIPEKTNEIILISQCEGKDTGALDIVALPNDPPIISLKFNPSKFIKTCEDLILDSGAQDPNNDTLSYEWKVLSGPDGATIDPKNKATAKFRAMLSGDYTLKVRVCDGFSACVELEFPVHVSGESCGSVLPPGTASPFCDNPHYYFCDDFESETMDVSKWTPNTSSGEVDWEQSDGLAGERTKAVSIPEFENFEYELKVKVDGYAADPVFRYQDRRNYYMFQLDADEGDYGAVLARIKLNGVWTKDKILATSDAPIVNNQWFIFNVIAQGNNFKFYIDKNNIGEWTDTDNTFQKGRIGFRETCYQHNARFDYVYIK